MPATLLKSDSNTVVFQWILQNSQEHISSKMFSDSNITKDFTCGKRKCSYIVKSRLLPYFLELLNSELSNASHYVALFDESYNNAAKENQMDSHKRML